MQYSRFSLQLILKYEQMKNTTNMTKGKKKWFGNEILNKYENIIITK